MNMTPYNYRPPLKTRLRLRHGLFYGICNRLHKLNIILVVVIIASMYQAVAYVNMLGDRKAAEAKELRCQQK